MLTVLTELPEVAAQFIRQGDLAAFPTETVYGLGADIFSPSAIEKIFIAKKRPPDNPLIAHISSIEQLSELALFVPGNALRLMERFFPGPLTIVFPKKSTVPDLASAGLATIGVRMPKHPVAKAFLEKCGCPVAAPSANLSGKPSPTSWEAVYQDLSSRISCILKGERANVGVESTVVDCTEEIPVLLRPGAISVEQVREVVPTVRLMELGDEQSVRSPGVRHRHYSPNARIIVIRRVLERAPPISAYIGLTSPPGTAGFVMVKVVGDVADYAYELFDFFRECDRNGIKEIYCERVSDEGLGRALMDRVDRAARG